LLETDLNNPAKKSLLKRILKIITWLIFLLLTLLLIGISLVFIYEKEVKNAIINEINKQLKTEVRILPENINLTIISSFPKCALEFKNLTAMESWKRKERDTLLFAEKIQLKFNLKDLFEKKYNITHIAVSNCRAWPKCDKNGQVNYQIWETKKSSGKTDSLRFALEDISVKNFSILWIDKKRNFQSDFTISDLAFSGNFSDESYALKTKGSAVVQEARIGKINYIENKKLQLDIDFNVNDSEYHLQKARIAINQMKFDIKGSFKINDGLQSLDISYAASDLDIESLLSLLPEKSKREIEDYKSSGDFYAKGEAHFSAGKKINFRSTFGIQNGKIEYKPQGISLNDVKLKGELVINAQDSWLQIKGLSADLKGDQINGDFLYKNFDDPYIEMQSRSDFDLQNLFAFWPIDTLQRMEGKVRFNAGLKGLIRDIKTNAFSEKVITDLDLNVSRLRARFKHDASDIEIETCKVMAHDRSIRIENLKIIKGKSDIALEGQIPGLFNYILDRTSPLIIRGKFVSHNLIMEDLIFGSSPAASRTEVSIPSNLNLILDASIANFSLGKFNAQNISGNFELKNQKAMVSDMQFSTMQGTAVANALADASGKYLDVSLQAKLVGINVKDLFVQMNNFGQTTLNDNHINGIINAGIDFSGRWDKFLNPDLNSIQAVSDLTIDKGELNEFKPLESLARFVDISELKRIKFATLSSLIEIKNGIIKIPTTTIKNSVINLDFSGTHYFNNKIEYHFKLLVSELLAKKRKKDEEFGPEENDPENRRSALILMTGTVDNPIIKYDRKGLKQKIKEDMKREKNNLKQILKNEFGIFKKDSLGAPSNKASQKFVLEPENNNSGKKPLELKKKKDEDDDF
jgi:hypothetical protein